MTDVVWIYECRRCGIFERSIQKTPLDRKYKKHVKDGCLEVKEVYPVQMDQRFSF